MRLRRRERLTFNPITPTQFTSSTSLTHQFYAGIASTAFRGIVGIDRARCTETCRGETLFGNTVTRDKRLNDRRRTALREIEIRGIASNVIGVALNTEFPVRMIAHSLVDFAKDLA